MAKQILSGAALFLDAYDVSGDHNAIAYDYSADAVETTPIGATSRTRVPGLKQFSASMAGLWEAGTGKINDTHFNAIGAAGGTAMTLVPKPNGASPSDGDAALFGSMVSTSYAPGAAIGDKMAFAVAMQGSGGLYFGQVAHNFAGRTASGTGTIFNLGAPLATQTVAAALHVYSASGTTPSLQVVIESAPLVGFGSPSPRIDFGASALIRGALQTIPGGTTDAFWRVKWTISGTSPSFAFLVALAIQ